MTRFKLVIEYDGADYAGWQQQEAGVPSIQAALQAAIVGFCQQRVLVHAAGRTDAGVHALGMVAHVDLAGGIDARTLRKAVNAHLRPQPIAVLRAEGVADDFHARFSCVERRYLYRIMTRRAPLALERDRAWQLFNRLDIDAMQRCAQLLIGRHDFSTFRAAACQADSPVKTLDALTLALVDGPLGCELQVRPRARSFLHHQVRNIVGTLAQVGLGRWSQARFEDAFRSADRRAGGPTAPAHGLYFVEALYDQPQGSAAEFT